MQKPKIAILVDALTNKGGIERVMLEVAKYYDADVYVGVYNPETSFEELKKLKITQLITKKLPNKLNTLYSWYKFSKLKLKKKYDCFLFFGTGSLNAAKNHKPNIWYCTSPSRYLYDLYERELTYLNGINKPLFKITSFFMKKIDQKNNKEIREIITISNHIQKRVKKYYNRDSTVIYPFVDIEKFKFIEQGDFYFSSGRLDRIKRVNLIINAFKKMPSKKLVIASDGPEKNNLMELAKDSKNISFLGYVSEQKLNELYGKCTASIYLSYNEDFGLIPIESMSAGKPCIATNQGGFKETIIHKKTGYLVDNPEKVEEVINAVNYIDKKRAILMRTECEKRANLFSKRKILDDINKLISSQTKKES